MAVNFVDRRKAAGADSADPIRRCNGLTVGRFDGLMLSEAGSPMLSYMAAQGERRWCRGVTGASQSEKSAAQRRLFCLGLFGPNILTRKS
jgi:hypothetical protein